MAQVEPSGARAQPRRPAHLQWRYIALVAAGGAAGTALRAAFTPFEPEASPFPVTTFGINLTGAFVLGVLLEALARSGPDAGRRLGMRLFLGTGVLGGFTTYSALATASARLTVAGDLAWALAYGLGTVALGAVASLVGIALGSALGRRHPRERSA